MPLTLPPWMTLQTWLCKERIDVPGNNTVRWGGLAGTGTIAREFARTLAEVPSALLAAAASRTMAASGEVLFRIRIPQQHLSFQDLAHDPQH